MAAPTVYSNTAEGVQFDDTTGRLFEGKKFWVSQRAPLRNRLLDDIRSNGGTIVPLEKQADFLIADHFKKAHCPPGSVSYEFVQKSIDRGELQDPEDHRCGPAVGEAREVGSISRPTKTGRTPYTAEEDQVLYKWVMDAEAKGRLISGNAVYKELEAQCPRHTWQSWRDRYLKQLRHKPPSTFNLPDNAPPSPDSDRTPVRTSMEAPAAIIKTENSKEKAAAKIERTSGASSTAPAATQYTVQQLAATFDSTDWEELYAFTETINATYGTESYLSAWQDWADAQDNQTAEQWRQYFEKIIRPQWLRDPPSKREQVFQKVSARHNRDALSQTQRTSQSDILKVEPAVAVKPEPPSKPKEIISNRKQAIEQSQLDRFERILEMQKKQNLTPGYAHFARAKKWDVWNALPGLDYTELHRLLMGQWKALPRHEQAQYEALSGGEEKHSGTRRVVSSGQAETRSQENSTSKIHNQEIKTRKRRTPMFEDDDDDVLHHVHELKKPRRSDTQPSTKSDQQKSTAINAETQPVAVMSRDTTRAASDSQGLKSYSRVQTVQREYAQSPPLEDLPDFEPDIERPATSIETDTKWEFDNLVDLNVARNESADDLSSNVSTPRANPERQTKFDTQAILSSPSQGLPISRLPLPSGLTQDLQSRSSSPIRHPGSEDSTTHSLQEFRRSLNQEDFEKFTQQELAPLPRPTSPSPAPSEASTTDSGDPDVPLGVSDLDEFFDERIAEGFANDQILDALKCTRWRPGLAVIVLDAWKAEQPLPQQRGIWSTEEDEAVESGDGLALAKLQMKHSLDGWGGVTERMVFLEAQRSR